MYLLIVEESFVDIVVSNVPCISEEGYLIVPSDCEQELIDLEIPYIIRQIKL